MLYCTIFHFDSNVHGIELLFLNIRSLTLNLMSSSYIIFKKKNNYSDYNLWCLIKFLLCSTRSFETFMWLRLLVIYDLAYIFQITCSTSWKLNVCYQIGILIKIRYFKEWITYIYRIWKHSIHIFEHFEYSFWFFLGEFHIIKTW